MVLLAAVRARAGVEDFLDLVGGAEANQQSPSTELATLITMSAALICYYGVSCIFSP